MEPYRWPERRPGRPRPPWHFTPNNATSSPGLPLANAWARMSTPEQQHIANIYHNNHSEALSEAERTRMRDAYAADIAQIERHRLENPRRGSVISGPPSRMLPPPLPSSLSPGHASLSPAAILEVERNRLRNQRRGAISFGSMGTSPPPPPPFPPPGLSSVNPAAVARATEHNRLRSPSLPYGPPPPPRPSSDPSLDEAPSQGTANLYNDTYPIHSAVRERAERDRLRNLEPFAQGSDSHGLPQFPAPPTALPSEFPLSNERLSQGTLNPNNASLSAAIQEAVDYNRDLDARGTGSHRRHPPLLPATERTPSPFEPDWTRSRELQPPNRRTQPMSEIPASLTSAGRRVIESGARFGETSSPHQDASAANPNYGTNTMTGSDTRPRTRHIFLGRDLRADPSAGRGASYLRLSNEKIESFVQGLPVHLVLDLPADKQDCAICMEKYYGPHQRESPIRLPCNHVLGKDCLLTWLKSPPTNRNNNCCPVCRSVLLERVPIFLPYDDTPSDTSSEHLENIFDQYDEGLTDQWTDLYDNDQARRDLQRERIAIERNEHERIMTARDQEHESWFREREEQYQRELVRLRQEHSEHMDVLQGMRGERRRRRTGS